jgi:hypothetical protein
MDRPHPDLHRRLKNVSEARKFIDNEEIWHPLPKPPNIFFDLDRVIPLDNEKISDSDAVYAALEILNSVVIPEAFRESQYARWHH